MEGVQAPGGRRGEVPTKGQGSGVQIQGSGFVGQGSGVMGQGLGLER